MTSLGVIAASCGGVSARSNEDGDSESGASGEAGETARGGAAAGGTSGASTGGASGRGGSASGGVATGGTDGGGGTSPTGGAGGVSGTGGSGIAGTGGSGDVSGGAGGTGVGPYACDMPKVANCGAINDFPLTTAQSWGSGDFSGGISVFGSGIQRDMTTTSNLHITGMVAGYGNGFNLWLTWCSTFAAYEGITFTLSGTTTDAMTPNTLSFEIPTNANYPWQPFVLVNGQKGACTAPDPIDPWSLCISPTTSIMLSASPTFVPWAQMMGGSPVPWDASRSPAEIVGIQWQFPWSEGRQPYLIDVTLDDVLFTGGTGPTTACPRFMQ